MSFKIEKGVPAPGRHHLNKYPFGEMDAGDSFLVNGGGKEENIINAAYQYGKVHNKKFSCRRTPDGMRIWRVA